MEFQLFFQVEKVTSDSFFIVLPSNLAPAALASTVPLSRWQDGWSLYVFFAGRFCLWFFHCPSKWHTRRASVLPFESLLSLGFVRLRYKPYFFFFSSHSAFFLAVVSHELVFFESAAVPQYDFAFPLTGVPISPPQKYLVFTLPPQGYPHFSRKFLTRFDFLYLSMLRPISSLLEGRFLEEQTFHRTLEFSS